MREALQLFAACLPGIEPMLLAEVQSLGAAGAEAGPGGVGFHGDAVLLHRAHLELGLASHLRVRVARFRARAFSELVRKTAAVDWAVYVDPARPLRLHATARASRLYHTGGIAQRLREGLEARLGPLASAEGDEDAPAIVARIDHDRCTLSLDTTGAGLHRRGYRLITAKAPLREDLARALVRASGWTAEEALADPFCGSGTVAIEAALLGRRIAPGRLRRFALEQTPLYDERIARRVRGEADGRVVERLPHPIFASDRDGGAVAAAEANAERAGVRGSLLIARAALGDAPFLEAARAGTGGLLVTNPPHGHRVGKAGSLAPLYQTLGRMVRELHGWRVAVLVADRRLALRTGLDLETALLTDQGGSKVRVMVARP